MRFINVTAFVITITTQKYLARRHKMRTKIHPKKSKTAAIIIPLFIVSVMVLSVFSIIGEKDSSRKVRYKEHLFFLSSDEQIWELEQDGKTYEFHYLPTEISTVPLIKSPVKRTYYLVADPSANYSQDDLSLIGLARFEMQENLGKKEITTILGFSREYNSIPPVTCANATTQVGVIQFQLGNKTRVISEANCILIEGHDGLEVIKAKDTLMYSLLGVE